ncbi:hypothetical protein [Halorhabdus rudnickae]|nr:hypothetical protein [Halorhabdus rudnickae]
MPRADDPDGDSEVQSFQSSPERTVFTEEGNPDGWIATDLAVEPSP